MKTAVVYYSMSGNTQQTAEKIAKEIGADLIRIEPKKAYPSAGFRKFLWGGKSAVMGDKPALQPYRFDDTYDRIIFGTPVWAGSFTPPLRTFITENRENIEGKPAAVFVCYSGGGTEKAIDKLSRFIGKPFEAELILVDPKDNPSAEKDESIAAFCEQLVQADR